MKANEHLAHTSAKEAEKENSKAQEGSKSEKVKQNQYKAWNMEEYNPVIIQKDEDIFTVYGYTRSDNENEVYSSLKTKIYHLKGLGGKNNNKAPVGAPASPIQDVILKCIYINLCTERFRENLFHVATRIQKFIGRNNAPLSEHFPRFYQIFILKEPFQYYAVMDYIAGKTLHSKVTNKEPISTNDVKAWIKQLASGLCTLRLHAIAHR